MGLKNRIKQRLKYLINRYPPIGKLVASFMGLIETSMLRIGSLIDKHFSKYFLIRIFRNVTKGRWGGRVVPLNINIPAETKFLPYQEILEIISRSNVFAISVCYCRTKHRNCNNPTHTCFMFGPRSKRSFKEIPSREVGYKHVSKEELIRLLEDCDNRGLVHQLIFFPNPDFYYGCCNCCTCCCEILHNYKRFLNPRVVKSDFIEQTNSQICKNCGTCTEICPFSTRRIINEKLIVDKSKCMGCGICIRKCPENAIKLIKRKELTVQSF